MKSISNYKTFVLDWDGTISRLNILYRMNRRLNPYWLYKKSVSFRDTKAVDKSEIRKMLHKVYVKGEISLRDEENLILAKTLDMLHIFAKPCLNYGAKAFLEVLSKKHKNIALLTDGKINRVIRETEILKVYNYFDVMLSAQTVGKLKPNPTGVNVILNVLKVKKTDSIMIGDTPDDILAAKNAGIASCAVAAGLSNMRTLKRFEPDYSFDNMKQLKDSFNKRT